MVDSVASMLKDSMMDSDDSSDETDSALSAFLQKLAFNELTMFEKPEEEPCSCDSCKERKSMGTSKIEELKMIHSYWIELRQYIRMVYRLSMKGSLQSIDDEYRCYVKDMVGRLCELCNPHQLYQRLEELVREYVVEIKVRLLQLMDRLAENPQLPRLFISGMLERYNKMMAATEELTPVLHQLEIEHLSKFKLSWKILNQRLFQTTIYTDLFFQNSVPLFITQLGKVSDSDENKTLVREFLTFDDEITLVEGMWADVESRIKLYTQNQTNSIARQKFLKDGWQEINKNLQTQDKLCFKHAKALERYLSSSDAEGADCEDKETIVLGSCECHVCFSTDEAVSENHQKCVKNCDHDKSPTSTNCIKAAAVQKNLHHSSETTPDSALREGNVQNFPEKPINKVDSVNHSLGLGKSQPFKRRTNRLPIKDHDSSCVLEERIKDLAHHSAAHVQDSIPQDSLSADSPHCDCCYCEVFGHGMPATAPMSKNYKEMRERLRLLLNKKKSKRRTSSAQSNTNANSKPSSCPPSVSPSVQQNVKKVQQPEPNIDVEKETRTVEDLLDFIEGTEVKCKNEKKAAKKARQKEKKQMLLIQLQKEEEEKMRRLEEERLRKEHEAAMLEAAKNLQKSSKKKKNKNKSKDSPNVSGTNKNKTNFPYKHENSGSNPGTQMVTIKRVMEPHDSEPTVTITLRGPTPKQDKVLYTLFNGQVCDSLKANNNVSKDVKHNKEIEKPATIGKKGNSSKIVPSSQVEQVPKESKRPENDHSQNSSKQKQPKELTNPTSIQISNAITTMTKNTCPDFSFDEIKLPPGITITKVDPSNMMATTASKAGQETKKTVAVKTAPKPTPKRTPPSEVIIVSTNKIKQPPNPVPNDTKSDETKQAQKKSKKKKLPDSTIKPQRAPPYPGLDIEPIHPGYDPSANLTNQMSVLTINPYADNKDNMEKPTGTTKKKKKKQKKLPKIDFGADTDEWNLLDSVFAPKDLDLNDGDIDDAERELEAFKLFCMQSVPLKRKEKVNLNLKDLVLKKKSPISCT